MSEGSGREPASPVDDGIGGQLEPGMIAYLLEHQADPCYVIDPADGTIVHANRAGVEQIGYTLDELLGRRVDEISPAFFEDVPVARLMDQLRKRGEDTMETKHRRKDGSLFPVETRARYVQTPERDLVIATCRDISERVQAYRELERSKKQLAAHAEELERSNQRLQDFAYIVSHDLREPLRMVKSYAEMLQRRYGGELDEDADDFIGFIVESVERMDELIKGLVSYSRVESRGGPFGTVDLEEVVDEVIADLSAAIEEAGAEVTHEGLPTVQGDRRQLGQLFQNLVANGIKFNEGDRPTVHLSGATEGGMHAIEVEDNGIGIDPEQTARIFKVFQRLHGRDAYGGTGMGLAICKRIVDRHGGEISVASEPGEGSTFTVRLPVDA